MLILEWDLESKITMMQKSCFSNQYSYSIMYGCLYNAFFFQNIKQKFRVAFIYIVKRKNKNKRQVFCISHQYTVCKSLLKLMGVYIMESFCLHQWPELITPPQIILLQYLYLHGNIDDILVCSIAFCVSVFSLFLNPNLSVNPPQWLIKKKKKYLGFNELIYLINIY